MNPTYNNPDVHSPNDMVLDQDEFVVDGPEDEKDDVALIHPDQLENGLDSLPKRPRADDYNAMKSEVLPPLLEQPPIIEDAVNTWQIEGWHNLNKKEHGPVFEAGGSPWRILMFPFGNNVDFCSFYLEQGFPDGKVPEDWVCCAQFALVMWNPNDPTIWTTHHAHHRFTKEEGDWGFTRFVEMRKLFNLAWENSGRPIVENEAVNVTAYVRVVKDETGVLWHSFTNYDSKKETGFVGLKNQGATCYLNSLIQSLYFTNAFRKAVYQIPTQDEESLSNSAYTLQRLFYQLQTSSSAVGTNELTKSFGWETRHIFEQQDVQELSRKLMERMEEKMKGTEAENALSKLFCGKVRTYISCINVQYESRRVEDFWDIQLNVAGNRNLAMSFDDYINVETMDGENQYFAGDEFKLQDAKKGVIFESFPDVLHLQLKRFQYDFERDAMMKINDRYEFPDTFDAAPYLSEDAEKSESYIYQLHGVLVHSGDLNAGHYYAFIKPTKDGWFYKYDDDKVMKATMREVLEENYGGEYIPPNGLLTTSAIQKTTPILRQNSAYMLVYIRQTRVDEVLRPVTQDDTPPHLQKKLDEEAAYREARRKEREEQHLYLNVRVITEDTFQSHGGTDLTVWDQTHDNDPAAARHYRLLKKSTIQDLAATVGKDIQQDPKKLRFWCMVNRQNKTIRPDTPISDTAFTIEETYQRLSGTKEPYLRVWTESAEEVGPDGEPIWPSYQLLPNGTVPRTDLILIFLKEFDVEAQVLKGVGHVYISKEKKVEDLVPVINKKIGVERGQLRLWEEIKPNMIDPMKPKQTLKAAELQDGDIVCFQRVLSDRSSSETKSSESERESISLITDMVAETDINRSISRTLLPDRLEDASRYYEFLITKRNVHFAPHPTRGAVPAEQFQRFQLTLSSKYSYDQVAAKVGEKIGIDPTHIRFWSWNSTTNSPKNSIKRNQSQNLHTILNPGYNSFSNTNQRNDGLFFEILDMSLSELDTKKSLKVIWLVEGIVKDETLDILVPKNGIVADIVAGIIKKAEIDDEVTGGPIRIYEVHSNKIHKELARDHPVLSITDYVSLIAERIPAEEVSDSGHSVQAFHFQNEPNKAHGIPFKFHVKEVFSLGLFWFVF
ncbi:ubiquitin carboxyl-terminal hydrolase [Phlyctema vagabunda]|uniref:ubiquitinyl hydrolase 1 n=1 Tax=Phlyctema vagabunda TaxID=108571 RepID=A0ABR4PIE9_9HELO